jgi:hypothetical protein
MSFFKALCSILADCTDGIKEPNSSLVKTVMSKLIKFSSLLNPLELRSDHFASLQNLSGGINEDPTDLLDVAKQPPNYVFKNNLSLTNSTI